VNIIHMKELMKIIIILATISAVAGCSSGYTKFYTPVTGATPEKIAATRSGPPPATPVVEILSSIPDANLYGRRGYAAIGYSSFNSGGNESEKDAISQGIKIGADLVVLVNPKYTGSTTSQIPITIPTTQTSNSTGSATAYGPGGTVNVYGNATTTTYGSTTSYIPLTVNRYNYGAIYYVKRKYIFGANWRDLTDVERSQAQSNSGVYVQSIVDDTPAFVNDFFPGDIITRINDERVSGSDSASDLIQRNKGRTVDVTFIRNGKELKKSVRMTN